jgi:hypothetical protein
MNSHAGKTGLLALLMVLTLSGCHKKKEATLPPQSQAPTVETPQPETTTTQPNEPSATAPATSTPSSSAPAEPSAPATADTTTKPKPKPRKPKNHTKPATGTTAGAPPANAPNGTQSQTSKVVVPQGGEAPTGQISAAGPDDDTRSRQTIEQLLQSTDTNLRSISRQLNDNERAMVEQIRTYMAQARTASTDGDLTRANNLALKAHLLSDELVKR